MPALTISAVLSSITIAVRLGHFIYEKVFRSGIEYHEDYKQLRNAVGEIAHSLEALSLVYQRANLIIEEHGLDSAVSNDLDVIFLKQITGDFQQTLQECKTLLEENEECARLDGGFKNRLVWNYINNRVKELRERMIFHNVRINQLLQPVQMRLTLNVEQAVNRGFNRMDTRFDEIIQEIRSSNRQTQNRTQTEVQMPVFVLPPIPGYLLGRFHQQKKDDIDLPVNNEIRISSIMGHLANVGPLITTHSEGQSTAIVQRYVDLMKAAWISEKANQLATQQPNVSASITTLLVQTTRTNIEEGFMQFGRGSPFQAPSEQIMIQQSDIDFKLWLYPPGSRPLRPPVVDDSEELLMDAALLASTATEKIELVVASSLANRNALKIVQTDLDQIGRSSNRETYNIDLRKVALIPTYAELGAQIFKVQVRESPEDQRDKIFDFGKKSDLLRFQQCLTGYEVKLDEPEIETVSYKHGGFRVPLRMKDICGKQDFGQAQIWYHQPLGQRGDFLRPLENGSRRRFSSTSSGRNLERGRKMSHTSSRSSTLTLDKWTSINAPITTPSSYSAPGGAAAQEVPSIEEPKVVFFITVPNLSNIRAESSDVNQVPKSLSYFTFSLNENIYVAAEACDCHRNNRCRDLVVKSRGTLVGNVYHFEEDRNAWNLAPLGASDHHEKDRNLEQLNGLDRIVVRFKDAGARERFARRLTKTRDLYEVQRAKREEALAKIRRDDIVECHETE